MEEWVYIHPVNLYILSSYPKQSTRYDTIFSM